MREITFEQAVHTNTDRWLPGKTDSGQVETLEQGKVLYLPRLGFAISAKELLLLDVSNVKHGRKNISFNPVKNDLNGVANDNLSPVLTALFSRYYRACCQLMDDLIPEYSAHLHSPMNTLRLHSVNTWSNKSSWRKDDRRIHVDAFPSRPNRGERILRLFTNINPLGESREWLIGEPFHQLAERFLPQLTGYSPKLCWLQYKIGITKSLRTQYDDLMLKLHDCMKSDRNYQRNGPQLRFNFPAGTSWICFSDQTPHAVMSGQYMLEQTWFLPVSGMQCFRYAPLKVLEALTGKVLI